jgi:YrbI family 3-deoxy-D-manno-octulosonate 8-phosphate phosphatase
MSIFKKCKKIKALITDVDGVLTDGGVFFSKEGLEIKRFNTKDGLVCQPLIEAGITLGVITGNNSDIVLKRVRELGFELIYEGVSNKYGVLQKIVERENLEFENIAYIGDDTSDLEIIKVVGLSATPCDSFDYIKKEVDYVCDRRGGDGAFREFGDLILGKK